MAVGSNTSLIMAAWAVGGPCTPESLDSVCSSLVPTNKSYLPIKKKKKELSCCFGGSGGGSDGLLLFLIDTGEYPKEPH